LYNKSRNIKAMKLIIIIIIIIFEGIKDLTDQSLVSVENI